MKLLELFSGTGSVGKAFRDQGWEVISVGSDPKMQRMICCDVRKLDAAPLPPIDCVWASPVCTKYSIARSTGPPRDLD
jgi:site-specific DNA-cytosine methylase